MGVLSNLVYMLSLLGVGVAARHAGVLTPARRDLLTRFAFVVALPALVFDSTYDQALGAVVSWRLVVGVGVAILATAALGVAVHRRVGAPSARSTAVVQSYHSNLGFLGLPIVATTFGGLAAAKASVVLGVGALVQIPLTVFVLVSVNDADAAIRDELREFLANPVVAALVAGLASSHVGVTLPAPAADAIAAVASAALPVALLAVGASVTPDLDGIDVRTVGSVVAVKVFLMPVVALAVFLALGAATSTLRAGVLMVAMPTAVSTFVYASELGGDTALASANVFVTTVVSLVAVFLAVPVVT